MPILSQRGKEYRYETYKIIFIHKFYSYFACVFVHTIYSTSSLNGFKNANADVLNHTQSRFLARNLYITDTTCPFNFNTEKVRKRVNIISIDGTILRENVYGRRTLFEALPHVCQIFRMEEFVTGVT